MAIEVLQVKRLSCPYLPRGGLKGEVGDRGLAQAASIARGIRRGRRKRRSARVVHKSVEHPVADGIRQTLWSPLGQRVRKTNPGHQRLIQSRQRLGQRPILNVRGPAEVVHRLGPRKCEIELQAARKPLGGGRLEGVIPTVAQRRVYQADRGELRVRP